MALTAISILFIIFILQQCTPLNITSASIFKSSKLEAYPYLKEGVKSDNFTFHRLPGRFPPAITYNAEHNFFLVDGYQYFKKLDANENEVISIKKGENLTLANFTYYLFSNNGVYDLSEEDIKEVKFSKIINEDRLLGFKAWIKLFDTYYQAARVVVYGEKLPYDKGKGFPVYFKIGKMLNNLTHTCMQKHFGAQPQGNAMPVAGLSTWIPIPKLRDRNYVAIVNQLL